MTIFGYTLRKPWVKYVNLDIEEKIFYAVRKSIVEDIIRYEEEDGNMKTDFLIKYTREPGE
jgi:hypothetical protein